MKKPYGGEEKIYLQLARSLEDDIVSGIIREGEPVPSTNHFAEFLQINPATAAKGVGILFKDGLLFKKRGVGMFVAEGARQKILERRQETFRSRYIEPMLEEATRIGISRQDLLAIIMSNR